jgi:hypothetical protein
MIVTNHERCSYCGRLLVRRNGKFPPHRVPQPAPPMHQRGVKAAVPLTGRDSPWCRGGEDR